MPDPYPKGARVEKCNTVDKQDMHRDGATATIIESLGPSSDNTYGYFVQWDDLPGVRIFIAGSRLKLSS